MPGHAGAENEGEENDLVGVDAHQRGRIAILREGAHGGAHLGLLHDEVEDQHGDRARSR